jgi:hypothetical protein
VPTYLTCPSQALQRGFNPINDNFHQGKVRDNIISYPKQGLLYCTVQYNSRYPPFLYSFVSATKSSIKPTNSCPFTMHHPCRLATHSLTHLTHLLTSLTYSPHSLTHLTHLLTSLSQSVSRPKPKPKPKK